MKPLDAAHFYISGVTTFKHECILCYLTRYGRMPDLPGAPLVAVLRRRFGPSMPWAQIARRIGVTDRTLYRWRHGHSLRYLVADAVLIELGLNWWEVWAPDEHPDIAHRLTADV